MLVTVMRLPMASPDTTILSSLCSACPHAAAGCCVAPPRLDLADIGRIVARGGRDWLLAELASDRIFRPTSAPWLSIRRVSPDGASARCGFHGERGCTIAHDRRPATCNFYVCEEALVEGKNEDARRTLADLVERFGDWDRRLGAALEARWPDPGTVTLDAPFLDWLGASFVAMTG